MIGHTLTNFPIPPSNVHEYYVDVFGRTNPPPLFV